MRTEAETRAIRDETISNAIRDGYLQAGEEVSFGCDGCPDAVICEFVYDLYNLNGDCLANK